MLDRKRQPTLQPTFGVLISWESVYTKASHTHTRFLTNKDVYQESRVTANANNKDPEETKCQRRTGQRLHERSKVNVQLSIL